MQFTYNNYHKNYRKNNKAISIYLPDDLYENLQKHKKDTGIATTKLIAKLIQTELDKYKSQK